MATIEYTVTHRITNLTKKERPWQASLPGPAVSLVTKHNNITQTIFFGLQSFWTRNILLLLPNPRRENPPRTTSTTRTRRKHFPSFTPPAIAGAKQAELQGESPRCSLQPSALKRRWFASSSSFGWAGSTSKAPWRCAGPKEWCRSPQVLRMGYYCCPKP